MRAGMEKVSSLILGGKFVVKICQNFHMKCAIIDSKQGQFLSIF